MYYFDCRIKIMIFSQIWNEKKGCKIFYVRVIYFLFIKFNIVQFYYYFSEDWCGSIEYFDQVDVVFKLKEDIQK